MTIDQIATLQLLNDLFLSIAGQLNKLKGTPKQRFARIEFFVDADFIGIHQDEWVVEILGLLKNANSNGLCG